MRITKEISIRDNKETIHDPIVKISESKRLENAHAQYDLAKCYENGFGVGKNMGEAVRCYILAANQGHAEAQRRLGSMYQHGIGVKQNEREAIRWYTKAAQQGNTGAQKRLSALYLKSDEEQSLYWTIQALAQQGRAPSQYRLGCYYAKGKFVERNYARAVAWWIKAAEQRNVAAQYCLAQIFLILAKKKDPSKNLSIALYWFQQMSLEPSPLIVSELKQQGITPVKKEESNYSPTDLKSMEIKHLSTLFRRAREIHFAKKTVKKEQKASISGDKKSSLKESNQRSIVQDFIQYNLQTASRIQAPFALHEDHFDNTQMNNDFDQKSPDQKKSELEQIAATLPKDIAKCHIRIPLYFAQYSDAIIEVPKDYTSDAPLLKDIHRNQISNQLLLIDSTVLEDDVTSESFKLESLIGTTRSDFTRDRSVLLTQNAALLNEKKGLLNRSQSLNSIPDKTAELPDKEKKYELPVSNFLEESKLASGEEKGKETEEIMQKINETEMKISEVEMKIKKITNERSKIIDTLLTQHLTDEKCKLPILAQKLSLTWAKQAICCFNQGVMYIHKFLEKLVVYLENNNPENQHKNIIFAWIHRMKLVINIYVVEDGLMFTSYLKGINYECQELDTIKPGITKQMPACEIRVDYRLVLNGDNATLVPQLYTSDIELAKKFLEAFCASQIEKHNKINKKPVSPHAQSFSDFSTTTRNEKKMEDRDRKISIENFLFEVYRTMASELPKDPDFELHLEKMARLSDLPESIDKYLAACYFKKMQQLDSTLPFGLMADLNPERSSLGDFFQLYQKLRSYKNLLSDEQRSHLPNCSI